MSSDRQKFEICYGLDDRDFFDNIFDRIALTNVNRKDVLLLERFLAGTITDDMCNVVETKETRSQNALSNAMQNFNAARIALAVRSTNASSGSDVANPTTFFERREQKGTSVFSENITDMNSNFRKLNIVYDTQGHEPDKKVNFCSEKHILTGNHTLTTMFTSSKLTKSSCPDIYEMRVV